VIREHRLSAACALAGLACVALGASSAAANALAAAAGTAFEAAPFLLVARVATRMLGPRLGGLANLGGCGCARAALPGALALPAIALCALAFGPLPTIARCAVALGSVAWRGRPARHARGSGADAAPEPGADPFADLETLAASAFLASLAATGLAANAPAIPVPLAFAAGLGLGVLSPCATAGIAMAAAFAHASPAIADAMLCSAGLWTLPRRLGQPPGGSRRVEGLRRDPRPARDAGLSMAVLAGALAGLALRGPSGLVSPRLLVPIGIAAALAIASVPAARSRSRASALVPLLMLQSVLVVPRPPASQADATRLDDAFPGERLRFVGVASADRSAHTTLTRYAITCCRLDATPVSVRLDRRLADASQGRWIAATGTLVNDGGAGLELRVQHVRVIAVPADPFLYR